jgi:hypothetical protein
MRAVLIGPFRARDAITDHLDVALYGKGPLWTIWTVVKNPPAPACARLWKMFEPWSMVQKVRIRSNGPALQSLSNIVFGKWSNAPMVHSCAFWTTD